MKQTFPWLLAIFLGLALVSLFPAWLPADDCDDPQKFTRPNPAGKPLYLRWAQGAAIPLGWEDANLPDILTNILDAAKAEWQSSSGGRYSFTSGTNVTQLESGTWSRPHDLAYTYVTPPTAGSPYATTATIEFDGTRVDWSVTEGACYQEDPTLYDFYSAAVHEVGHVLGLNDVNCFGDVMHFRLNDNECRRLIGDEAKAAIDYLYSCADCQNMVIEGLVACDDDCAPDDPIADVAGFNFVGGFAVWSTLREEGTAHYVIEGCNDVNGLGTELATEPSGVGLHRVAVTPGLFSWVRLVEVEELGRRFVRGIASSVEFPLSRATRTFADVRPPVRAKASPDIRSSLSVPPAIVIYPRPDLWGAVWDHVPWLWDHYDGTDDFAVEVVDIPVDPPGTLTAQEWIKADIASRHMADGTRRFHIVGDWRDSYPSDDANVSASVASDIAVEYIYSDQWYADVDDDEIPDVVVTRWPADDEADVYSFANNNYDYLNGLDESQAPSSATFLVGDVNEQGGSGELAAWMSEQVELVVPEEGPVGGLMRSRIYKSAFPDVDERNDETAELLNANRPELISILSTVSGSMEPGSFFAAAVAGVPPQNPWTAGMLESGWFVRMVIAASCSGSNWLQHDDALAGPAVCEEFLTAVGKGAIAWVGPMGGSLQDANYVVSRYIVEELIRNPYRPMADSWLVAMRRAYEVFEAFPEFLPTLKGYEFLGDPVSPFSRLPACEVSTIAKRFQTGSPILMPESFAVTCPGGDGDTLVVQVSLDADHLIGPLPGSALTMSQPENGLVQFFPSASTVQADAPISYIAPVSGVHDGYYGTTFTILDAIGCGVDSALVSLYGIPLGYAHLNVKSYDVSTGEGTHGAVNLQDFSVMGGAFVSSRCDCVYAKDYEPCVDYAMPDTTVNLVDLAEWWPHYNHEVPGGGSSPEAVSETAAGTVLIEFEEVHPLIGEHTLRAQVSLEGVEPFELAVFALHNASPKLEFLGWTEAGDLDRETLCIEAVRDGRKEVVIGVLGQEGQLPSATTLGTAEFRVLSDQQLVLGDEDLALVTADLLSTGSQRALAASSMDVRRAVASVAYENALAQNYPNPFNPTTTISFSLARSANANLSIYDVRGSLVRRLVDERKERGIHRVVWDGRNSGGQRVASGVYFYMLTAGSFTDTKKMTILK